MQLNRRRGLVTGFANRFQNFWRQLHGSKRIFYVCIGSGEISIIFDVGFRVSFNRRDWFAYFDFGDFRLLGSLKLFVRRIKIIFIVTEIGNGY